MDYKKLSRVADSVRKVQDSNISSFGDALKKHPVLGKFVQVQGTEYSDAPLSVRIDYDEIVKWLRGYASESEVPEGFKDAWKTGKAHNWSGYPGYEEVLDLVVDFAESKGVRAEGDESDDYCVVDFYPESAEVKDATKKVGDSKKSFDEVEAQSALDKLAEEFGKGWVGNADYGYAELQFECGWNEDESPMSEEECDAQFEAKKKEAKELLPKVKKVFGNAKVSDDGEFMVYITADYNPED